MDATEVSALEYGFGTLVTICLAVGGWLWARTIGALMDLRKDHQDLRDDHANYKLTAEQRFAKEAEVNNHFERLNDNMEAVRKDVSTINISLASLAASIASKMARD